MTESPSPWIRDLTTDEFDAVVVQQSNERPVIIDFWAPWCGPCRQLAPLLERLVTERDGQVLLVKVNVDEEPALAQAFAVQSIPMVAAIRNGQLVDRFEGLLPEEELRRWIDALAPSEADRLLAAAKANVDSAPEQAENDLKQVLELEPKRDEARIALADLYLRRQRPAEAHAIITELERRGFLEPDAERIKSELELLDAAADVGELDEVRARAEAHPDDLQAQLHYAEALAGARQYADALDRCLAVVQRDRAGFGEPARQIMVNIFTTLGNAHPLVGEYRRKLATALY